MITMYYKINIETIKLAREALQTECKIEQIFVVGFPGNAYIRVI